MKTIYLDNAATTPLLPEVLEAMLPYLKESYGNPSSLHFLGRKSRLAIENAREVIADFIGAKTPEQIIFTSGATEANNIVLKCHKGDYREHDIITSPLEHHSVLNSIPDSEKILCKVNNDGIVDTEFLKFNLFKNALNTKLCSIMAVNNEVGTVQPIIQINEMCKARNIPFHTDVTQAVGYTEFNVSNEHQNFDYLTFSGHKIHAPKGIGVLYAKDPSNLKILTNGGMQEFGHRAGTENVASIVGLAKACEIIKRRGFHNPEIGEMEFLRNYLQMSILREIKDAHVNCQYCRTPNILNIRFDGTKGVDLVELLSEQGICISSGSACNSGSPEPSHVLKAIGLSNEQALSSVRFSLGTNITKEDIDFTITETIKAVKKLRLYVQ